MGQPEYPEFVYQEKYTPPKRTSHLKSIKYVIDENGCWICTSHAKPKHRGGYPVITRNGKFYRLSRYIYEQEHGEIPEGMYIMHLCDNPECINPNHLQAGTPKDNTQDMIRKGRKPVGERVPSAKLTENDVREILKDARPYTHIALDYGVSKKAIQQIKHRKTWKHVKEAR
mgnify:CR=1 FL=1